MAIPAILGRLAVRTVARGALSKLGGMAVSGLGSGGGGASLSIQGTGSLISALDRLERMAPAVMEDAGTFFKNKTPVRSGNARNSTKTRDTTIHARYGYAKKLNDGFSEQAPNGMTDPTIVEMKKLVKEYVRGL